MKDIYAKIKDINVFTAEGIEQAYALNDEFCIELLKKVEESRLENSQKSSDENHSNKTSELIQ